MSKLTSRGARVGLRDLHYAILNTDGETQLEYEEPKKILGAVTANINPNADTETLFADDGPFDTMTALGEVELEFEAADVPPDVQAELLGHEFDEDSGIMVRKAGDVPPWVAVGFKSIKSDGKYRFKWLLKGKFQIPETESETRSDSIEYQTPSMQGAFVRRDVDDAYEITGDEGYENFDPDTWFSKDRLEMDYSGADWNIT